MKKLFLISAFFLAAATLHAQKEIYNWLFGSGAWLTWNTTQTLGGLSGLPTTRSGSAMTSHFEGTFTISNASGDLLFYSDGMDVWNRNHQKMPNGSGLTGNVSSAQSGIIIVYPGQTGKYILFSIDNENRGNLAYSVIDMSLDGGLGDIVSGQKNILLTGYIGTLGEDVTAVAKADGSGFWIAAIGKNSSPYSALNIWDVDYSGVNTSCFASYRLPADVASTGGYHTGYLNFSSDGTRFVWAEGKGSGNCTYGEFNPLTGVAYNIKRVDTGGISVYGNEFSPSGKVLYLSEYADGVVYRRVFVYRFDDLLAAANPATVAKRTFTTRTLQLGALQLGPDGRIYGVFSGSRNMLVITNPDDYSGSNFYQMDNILAAGTAGGLGLPNFVEKLSLPHTVKDITCHEAGASYSVPLNAIIGLSYDSVRWAVFDGNVSTPYTGGGTLAGDTTLRPTFTMAADGSDAGRTLIFRLTVWQNALSTANTDSYYYITMKECTYRWWYLSSPYADSNPRSFEVPTDTLGGRHGSMLGYYDETAKSYTSPFMLNTFYDDDYFEVGRGIIASLDTTDARFNSPDTAAFSENGYGTVANTGNITVAVTNTNNVPAQSAKRGQNLLGNPYLNYLNFAAFYSDNSAVISPTIWLRGLNKPSMKMTFDTYNASTGVGTDNIIGGNALNGHIPPVQGFWIHANRSGNVTFREAHQSSNTGAAAADTASQILRAPAALLQNRIARIKVSAGNISDQTILVFNPNASNAYDIFDSEKMSNAEKDIPELYTLVAVETGRVPSIQLVINSMPPANTEKYLPLGFRTGQQNAFTISGNFENCDNMQVILRDNQTGAETDLTAGNSYSFASDIYDNTARFTLKISGNSTGVNSITNDELRVLIENEKLKIENAKTGDKVQIFNAVGQKLYEQKLNFQFSILNFQLNAGVYLVKVGEKTERVVVK